MLERTDAITNEVLEPNKFVLAYPTVPADALLTGIHKNGVSV